MNNQIIDNLKKLLTSLKRHKFSLVNIYPSDVYTFENFKKTFESKLENIIVIQTKSKFVLFDKTVKLVSPKVFDEKKTEFFEKTKNAVVIWNDKLESLEGLQAYYPIIYVKVRDFDDFNERNKDHLEDWKVMPYEAEKLVVLINKNIKAFKSLTFDEFNISPLAKTSEEVKKEDQALKDLGLDLRYSEKEKVKFVTKLRPKNEINYSIFDNLPQPTIYPPNRNNVKWCQEFYSYIHAILKIIVPVEKERIIDMILNKQTLKVWLRGFTHRTINLNIEENYEALESVGDKTLKNAFSIYYFKRHPTAGPDELNNATKETQSDEAQAELSDNIGLIRWCKLDSIFQGNMKIKEDLLESLAGVITVILNEKNIYGFATDIFYNMFKLIYDDYTINARIDAATFVRQVIPPLKPSEAGKNRSDSPTANIRQIYMPRPKQIDYQVYKKILKQAEKIIKDNDIEGIIVDEKQKEKQADQGIHDRTTTTPAGKIKVEFYIDKFASDVFKLYGFNFKPGMVIGAATESTTAPAKRRAGDNAREFLYKNGITLEWIKDMKDDKKMKDLQGLDKRALLKAKQKHKDIIRLGVADKKIKSDQLFILYGENKDGKKYNLEYYVSGGSDNNYLVLVKKYLGLD
jgi:dsRNA-specific ribonuclease